MAQKDRVTQSFPRTGASPIENTAEKNGGRENQGINGSEMTASDKQIYDIVQCNVQFANEQFDDNLRFNSDTLTNVLYSNIYKLLEDKFGDDDFVQDIADDLIANGCVYRVNDSGQNNTESQQEPSETDNVVYELDTTEYDELVQRIYSAIELIKANKLTIFKILSDVQSEAKKFEDNVDDSIQINRQLLSKRDEDIKKLVEKIQGNQETVDQYVQGTQAVKTEVNEGLDAIQEKITQHIQSGHEFVEKQRESIEQIADTLNNVKDTVQDYSSDKDNEDDSSIQSQIDDINKRIDELNKPSVENGDDVEEVESEVQTIEPDIVDNLPDEVDEKVEVVEQEESVSEVQERHKLTNDVDSGAQKEEHEVKQNNETQEEFAVEQDKSSSDENNVKPEQPKHDVEIESKREVSGSDIRETKTNQPQNSKLNQVAPPITNKGTQITPVSINQQIPNVISKLNPTFNGEQGLQKLDVSPYSDVPDYDEFNKQSSAPNQQKFEVVVYDTKKIIQKISNESFQNDVDVIEPEVLPPEHEQLTYLAKSHIDVGIVVAPDLFVGIKDKLSTQQPQVQLPEVQQNVPIDYNGVSLIDDLNIANIPFTPEIEPSRPANDSNERIVDNSQTGSITQPVGKDSVKPIENTKLDIGMNFKKVDDFNDAFSKERKKGKKKTNTGKKDGKSEKKKKTVIQKIKEKIGSKVISIKKTISDKVLKFKNKVGNSVIGKMWRLAKNVGSVVLKVGRIIKKVIVGAFKATKYVAKKFIKASHAVGKFVVKTGIKLVTSTINAARKMDSMKDQIKASMKNNSRPDMSKGAGGASSAVGVVMKPVNNMLNKTPALAITKIGIKIGWKAVKFIGKSIWKGIKKVTFAALAMLGKLFGIAIGFVNKIGTYVKKIGKGILNTAYKFIVKPIAAILTTVFGFAMSMVKMPIDFMKWLIPTIFERIHDCLSAIKQGVARVLKAAWSIIKKVLFNPITIAVLIGALFYFLWPKLKEWFGGGLDGIKKNFLPTIIGFAKSLWSFLKTAGEIVYKVGKWIFNAILWVTDPDSPLGKGLMMLIKGFMWLKHMIYEVIGASGKDTVDTFCMFLSGDYIGLAMSVIRGYIKKLINWVLQLKLFKVLLGFIDAYLGFYVMIFKMFNPVYWIKALADNFSLAHPIDSITGTISQIFIDPINEWWGKVKNIWSQDYTDYTVQIGNPIHKADEIHESAGESLRNLKKQGMSGEKNLKYMDSLMQVSGKNKRNSVLTQLENINKLYTTNYTQVNEYNEFLTQAWEIGKGNEEISQSELRELLTNSDLSQKLMSAFYYYNPQSGQLMSVYPESYLKGFIDNIRKFVDGDATWEEKFRTVIEAFDQVNMERSKIVNDQGLTIDKVAQQIANADMKDAKSVEALKDIVNKLNTNKLFSSDVALNSMRRMSGTEEGGSYHSVDGVTGELGRSGNKLLKVPQKKDGDGKPVKVTEDELKVKPVKEDKNQIGNITLPAAMNPPPINNSVDTSDNESLYDKYVKYLQENRELSDSGVSQEEMDKMGRANLTFSQFKEMYKKAEPKPSAEVLANRQKRLAGLRLANDIQAYNNQGQAASPEGFKIGKTPTLLNVPLTGLSKVMYLFSPDWVKVQGASKVSDEELMAQITAGDKQAAKEARKAREARLQKEREEKEAEEKERRRLKQILDYSAKVEGGFIEVKVGEDVEAMRDAWKAHNEKMREASDRGLSQEQMEKMGLVPYTWKQWKAYYRKMHGIPEDGIKRIPFEGKKKERNIDFGPRKALSSDELSKYGIKMSEDGPVMIPLDKAMEVTKSLISQAKTIYSVRDGLEIMREGLDSETEVLKKRNEGGTPCVVAQSNVGGESTLTTSVPSSSSSSSSD